jgi:hypothetical protein
MLKNPASKAFLIAILVSVVLPFIPVLKWALYPFDILNTHLHEMFHALATVATGGQVDSIHVFKSTEGVTQSRGGMPTVILMSGYLGSSLFGAFMIVACRSERADRIWLCVLSGLVFFSNIFWVRGDIVGWPIGILWPALIVFASMRLKGQTLMLAAQFLAVQQCLNSIKSLRDLVILSGSPNTTDAQMLADVTHIPAMVWAILWMIFGVFGIGAAVLKLNKEPKSPSSPVATIEP